jgi:hypothetical protein
MEPGVTVDDLLPELENVKKTKRGWMARCPAHEDSSPSLSIGEGDDGRILLKCWAGCTTDKVCAALGLTIMDLFGATDRYATSWTPKTSAERMAFENRRLRRLTLALELRERRTLCALTHATNVLAVCLQQEPSIVLDRVWRVALEQLDAQAAEAAQ